MTGQAKLPNGLQIIIQKDIKVKRESFFAKHHNKLPKDVRATGKKFSKGARRVLAYMQHRESPMHRIAANLGRSQSSIRMLARAQEEEIRVCTNARAIQKQLLDEDQCK